MPEQTILVVEDDNALSAALSTTLVGAGYRVETANDGEAALALLARTRVSLVLSDVQMSPMDGVELLGILSAQYPELPVIMMTAFATVSKAVDAMRAGANGYLVKPFVADDLIAAVADALKLTASAPARSHDNTLVCGDETTLSLLGIAARVARSDATVLLAGESGTGKEVFARYLHDNSLRADRPFVAINCAAIPESMLEATLFGHEKGAFTGADKSLPGKFELANGGTLLLDEISEMDLSLQAKLLRALQEREIERLGGKRPISVDVRVLATSNRNLAKEVESGRFREDLYYRLNVFPLYIPPLRERRGDVLPLVQHFLSVFCHGTRAVPSLSAMAEKKLVQHRWPGNVRELENVVQRSLILLRGDEISEADLVFEPANSGSPSSTSSDTAESSGDLIHDLRVEERRLIINALREGAGNREEAARRLGISPRTLRYKMARLREADLAIPVDALRAGAHSSVA
ncbi:MAG: sigma-54 dependent transcriptional regulator [Pseudomonadota bacterium]